MLTIGVRALKAELSRILRDVQAGERYLVTDRGRVVAELREPSSAADRAMSRADQVALRMAGAGELRVAERPPVAYGPSPVRLPDGAAREAIDWTRGGR